MGARNIYNPPTEGTLPSHLSEKNLQPSLQVNIVCAVSYNLYLILKMLSHPSFSKFSSASEPSYFTCHSTRHEFLGIGLPKCLNKKMLFCISGFITDYLPRRNNSLSRVFTTYGTTRFACSFHLFSIPLFPVRSSVPSR